MISKILKKSNIDVKTINKTSQVLKNQYHSTMLIINIKENHLKEDNKNMDKK